MKPGGMRVIFASSTNPKDISELFKYQLPKKSKKGVDSKLATKFPPTCPIFEVEDQSLA